MKKKVMSAVLAAAMVVGMAGNVVTVSAEEKYDLTLYSIDTTDPDFEDWLANVEDATGLNINVIAAPTDTDTVSRRSPQCFPQEMLPWMSFRSTMR